MAHPVEPMDIDCIDSDFDNKENTFHHHNVQPCTEKGYEELDVSELNMRLRYSVTPAGSPMSKSFTSCIDNKTLDSEDSLNTTVNEVNLTRSLNSTMTKNDSVVKSLKSLPLQSLPNDQSMERSVSVLRPLDSTITTDNSNITVTVSGTNDIDENLSLPSSSSSDIQTPEATTPTKDVPKNDGGSPIMRGLKSVLNMFRSSQSPIPPPENESTTPKQLTPTPSKRLSSEPRDKVETKPVLASTPIAAHREREGSGSKRNSPLKDSIIFNDDLEKELQWKDETTILFSEEKIPIHKLFPQKKNKVENKPSEMKTETKPNLDTTVEYMDISCNDSLLNDKTMTELSPETNKNEFNVANESDSEFLDCENESNVTKTESYVVDNKVEEFSKVLSPTQNIINNVTVNANEQEIVQKMYKTEKKVLDVTVPLGVDNMQGNVNNNLFTSSLINETMDTNKSTCEGNQNQTRLIENILQQSNLEISGIDCDLNNDVTVTLDCQENKNKYASTMLEVSTLESHTQSLSSLIESLDATKTIDQENKTLSNNNSLEIATPDQFIEVVHIEKQNPDLTITIQDQEIKIPEVNNTAESLNLPENSPFAAKDPNATIDILKQEDIEVKSDNSDSVEHKVVDTTINITYDKKEDAPMSIAQPEPSMPALNESRDVDKVLIAATEPSMPLNESPADIPLPDDEDIDKDIINSTDASAAVINDPQLPIFDMSKTEMEVKGILKTAKEVVSELICNVELLPDMILDTKDLNTDKEIISPIQLEVQPEKEEISDVNNMLCEVSKDPDSEVKKDVSMSDIENVNTTFDMQKSNIHESVNNVSILPDILNQKEVQDVEMMALDTSAVHTANSDVKETINKSDSNKSENNENNLSLSNTTQEGSVGNDEQSNIGSTILPDNQMVSLVLACEEILDKNREISEVILTEPQIDKLQHASDTMLSGHEVKEETSQISQNLDQLIPSNDLNNTFKKDEQRLEQQIEVNDTIIQLKTEDSNKTINDNTVQDNVELKITQNEEITILAKSLPHNKENENNINEDTNNKYVTGLDVTPKQEIEEVEKFKTDIIDTTNKTVIIDHDVHIKEGNQNDSVKENQQEALKNIEQDKTIGNESFSMESKTNDAVSEKHELVIAEDEIIVSENNSPYVSVAADLDKISSEKPLDNFEEIENPFAIKSKVPSSPPITSKGYNFNFDDIDDPFATKVKIRMSPAPETPNKAIEIKTEEKKMPKTETPKKDAIKNRRRSQPARHKLSNTKKPFNKTFDVSDSVPISDNHQSKVDIKTKENEKDAKVEEQQNMSVDFSNETKCDVITLDVNKNDHVTPIEAPQAGNIDVVDIDITKNATLTEQISADVTMSEENKDSIESIPSKSNDIKTTSSSEQSTYYSAGTSSTDSTKSRNVFNLPEIDDMNFNPFATKTKIRQSPPRDVGMENPFATKSKIINSPDSSMIIQQGNEDEKTNSTTNTEKLIEDKMETEPMEKDSSANISNITSSSKGTDKDDTIKEVNTEDEDTIEGPFIEAEYINEEQQSDFDGENIDMMQFNDLPAQEQDENAEGELFIDAEAFEFLLNQNKSNVVADSGKESLFLKFDPLFAKRMSSDSVVAALSRAKKRQSTPTRTPKQQRNAPVSVAGPSKMTLNYETDLNVTEAVEDLNTTVTKPMMVVTPAVNPNATLRKSVTPTRTNRRSITFTSPAMAVIDRLLSLSANSSLVEQETTIPQVSREQNEAELALTQLREVLAEKEIHVYNLRSESKELKDRLSSLESQMKVLEAEGQQRLKKINDLNDKLAEKTKMNKSMAVVVEEYERTIASLIAETEADKKRHAAERIALMNERDEQTAHLASMEVSFNDLHSKYEKSKQVIMNYKANEETYKQSLREFEENVTKMQKNYELLKQHATSKLNHANDELQKINRAHEAEVLKLNAMIKRKELHITSLEETLAQKTKANEELTAICDELINKVG